MLVVVVMSVVVVVVVSVVRERGRHKGREWDIRATILI